MAHPLAADLAEVLARTEPLWEELRGLRIFITGGTGFFGCWLLEPFVWANRRLSLNARAVVLTRDPQRFRSKAPHLAADPAITLHRGDVRDFSFPDGEFSHVIHGAAEVDPVLIAEQPGTMLQTIAGGTQRCLQLAASCGAQKLLLISSGAVYGKQPADLPHIPETYAGAPDVLQPQSAYAEGKRMAELECVIAATSGKLQAKIARCFAFVGPYMKMNAHFAIGNFIRDQLQGGPIVVKGDGTTVRSYLYASELAEWLWTILFRGENRRAYNVGSERAISIGELAEQVAAVLDSGIRIEIRGKPSECPPERYVPSTTRARRELGLGERVSLEDAIRRTQRWRRAGAGAYV